MSGSRAAGTLLVATLLSYLLGFAVGWRWLLPVLNTVPAYVLLFILVRGGRRGAAIRLMLLWAAALAVFGTLLSAAFPERAERVIWNGASYRDTMIRWVETGEGEESHPIRFLPRHARELALYLPVALVTGGLGSMLMGAILMNFMDFFVASLAIRSTSPWLVGVLGWFPWSIMRVGGYVILGVLAAEPLLVWIKGAAPPAPGRKRALAVAAALLVADLVTKTLVAPGWGRMLSSFLIEKPLSAP